MARRRYVRDSRGRFASTGSKSGGGGKSGGKKRKFDNSGARKQVPDQVAKQLSSRLARNANTYRSLTPADVTSKNLDGKNRLVRALDIRTKAYMDKQLMASAPAASPRAKTAKMLARPKSAYAGGGVTRETFTKPGAARDKRIMAEIEKKSQQLENSSKYFGARPTLGRRVRRRRETR